MPSFSGQPVSPLLNQQIQLPRNVVDRVVQPAEPLTGERNGPAKKYKSETWGESLRRAASQMTDSARRSAVNAATRFMRRAPATAYKYVASGGVPMAADTVRSAVEWTAPKIKDIAEALPDTAGYVAGDALALGAGAGNAVYNLLRSGGKNYSPYSGYVDNTNFDRARDHLVAIPMGIDNLARDLHTGMYRVGDIVAGIPVAAGNLAYNLVPRYEPGYSLSAELPSNAAVREGLKWRPGKALPQSWTGRDEPEAPGDFSALTALLSELDNPDSVTRIVQDAASAPRSQNLETARERVRGRYVWDDINAVSGPFKYFEPIAPMIERANREGHRSLQNAVYSDPNRPELETLENTGELAGELALGYLLGGAGIPAASRRGLPLMTDMIVNTGKGSSYSATHDSNHRLVNLNRDTSTPLLESILYPMLLGVNLPSYVHPTVDAQFYGGGLGGLANFFDAAHRTQRLDEEAEDPNTLFGKDVRNARLFDILRDVRTELSGNNDANKLDELLTPELLDWVDEHYPELTDEELVYGYGTDDAFAPGSNDFGDIRDYIANELVREQKRNLGEFGGNAVGLPTAQKVLGSGALRRIIDNAPGLISRSVKNVAR